MIPLSASQITTFDERADGGCQRKWAFKYIAKLPDPPGPAAELGTDTHTQLAAYMGAGVPLNFARESGYIAAPVLPFLPPPKSNGLIVEKRFEFGAPGRKDYGFMGYIDLWLPKGGMPLDDGATVNPTVVDFKTTSNWRYAKTPETLATDVQAMLYATWAMFESGARVADLVWPYMATKGARKAKRVHLQVTGAHVAEQFTAINETAAAIMAVRGSVVAGFEQEFPLTLKANPLSCESFGGCPFRSKCNLSPAELGAYVDSEVDKWAQQVLEAPVANTTQGAGSTGSLKARLAAARTASNPNGLSPAQLDGQGAADAGVSKVGIPAENLPTWATSPVDPLTGRGMPPAAVGINPPESLLPPAPPVGTVAVKTEAQIAAEGPQTTTGPRKGPGRPKRGTAPTPAPEDPKDLLLATTPDLRVPVAGLSPAPAKLDYYTSIGAEYERAGVKVHVMSEILSGETAELALARLGVPC